MKITTVKDLKKLLEIYSDDTHINIALSNQAFHGDYKVYLDDIQVTESRNCIEFGIVGDGTLPFNYELFGDHYDNDNEQNLEDLEMTIKGLEEEAESLREIIETESEDEEDDPFWEDDRDNDYAERYRDFTMF